MIGSRWIEGILRVLILLPGLTLITRLILMRKVVLAHKTRLVLVVKAILIDMIHLVIVAIDLVSIIVLASIHASWDKFLGVDEL